MTVFDFIFVILTFRAKSLIRYNAINYNQLEQLELWALVLIDSFMYFILSSSCYHTTVIQIDVQCANAHVVHMWRTDNSRFQGFVHLIWTLQKCWGGFPTVLLFHWLFSVRVAYLLCGNCLSQNSTTFLRLSFMVMMGWLLWIHPVIKANRVIISTEITWGYYISCPADRYSCS